MARAYNPMKTYNNLYHEIYATSNLMLVWKKAAKGKINKDYVKEFGSNLLTNLFDLQNELKTKTYNPKPLKVFILRDPKTRKISISDFRDRIVHHALIEIIEPIFDKTFIYDSCANRKDKGNLFAIKRFYNFIKKVSRNGKLNGWFNKNSIKGYCLKADIKHYFDTVDHDILLNIIKRKITDKSIICLIELILNNFNSKINGKGMPLGNLTSQFFANVYLNELDYFIKHKLKSKYYIRYVDDFIILHNSKEQLETWKYEINKFLRVNLDLELHSEKSKIIPILRGIDFVGFRNFYRYRLLRKRNIRKFHIKLKEFNKKYYNKEINYDNIYDSMEGWTANAKQANTYGLRKTLLKIFENEFKYEVSFKEVNRYLKN